MKGQRGGSVPNPNGINQLEGGFARVSVGRQTHTWLKQAAGSDESLSKCVRRLVLQELDKQKVAPALPGQGREVAKATVASVIEQNTAMIAKMEALEASYNWLELSICEIARFLGIEVLNTGIREKIKALTGSMKEQLTLEQIG